MRRADPHLQRASPPPSLPVVPLTASDLAARLGIDRTNAWRLIDRARREGSHRVTLGDSRGGRRPWVIWWPA